MPETTPKTNHIGQAPAVATPATRELQIAAIGIDSSHLPEFSKRIRKLRLDGKTRCRVTQMWTDGNHKMPADEVEKWRMQAEAEGVVMAESMDAMAADAESAVETAMPETPSCEVSIVGMVKAIDWFALAPT